MGFAAGDVNLYGFVNNNPVNYIDPEGKWLLPVLAPLLKFAAVKAGAILVAYTGTQLAMQGAKIAADACPSSNLDEEEMRDAINEAFIVTGAISAGEILIFGAGNLAVEYPTISATLYSNPAVTLNAADFVHGLVVPSPPPPSLGGYIGLGSREIMEEILRRNRH